MKSRFYLDVKMPINAGMPLNGNGSNKIKTVGYQVTRLYYDSKEKDLQIGSKVVKRIFL